MVHLAFAPSETPRKSSQAKVQKIKKKVGNFFSLQGMCMFFSFFFLSLSICFSIPSPYAVAAFSVFYLSQKKVLVPLFGVCVALLCRFLWRIELDAFQVVSCVMVVMLGYKRENTLKNAVIITSVALFCRSVFLLFTFDTAQEIILSFFSILLGCAALPSFFTLQNMKKGEEKREEDELSKLFPLLLLIMGMAKIQMGAINLGYLLGAYIVLFISSVMGSGVGICAGFLCALPIWLSGHNPLLMLVFSVSGMTAGLLKQKNKMLSTLLFIFSCAAVQYQMLGAFDASLSFSFLLSALCFLLTKKEKYAVMCQKFWCFLNRNRKENAFIKTELSALSNCLTRLTEALPEIDEPETDIKLEGEKIMASLCVGCEKMPICHHDKKQQTEELMQRLAGSLGYERVYHKIISEGFLECPRAQNIPPLIEEMVERIGEKQQMAVRAQNEREMLKTHLSAIALKIKKIKENSFCATWSKEGVESQVEEVVKAMRIPTEVLWAQCLDGQVSIALQHQNVLTKKYVADALIFALQRKLHVPLYYGVKNLNTVLIKQTPPLRLTSGFSSITSAQSAGTKENAPQNGDAYLLREVANGQLLFAMSDGMGHGEEAKKESRKTLEMLALCMHAGYKREDAMKVVNGMMLSCAQDERYATVDLCTLDCFTGQTVMNKLGACPSLLIRGRRIERIEGETLPLGILSHVVPMEYAFTMGHNDVLILMTDGVTDAFKDPDAIHQILYRVIQETPQIIADTLLQEALVLSDHMPKDDMSILCIKILDNENAVIKRKKAV